MLVISVILFLSALAGWYELSRWIAVPLGIALMWTVHRLTPDKYRQLDNAKCIKYIITAIIMMEASGWIKACNWIACLL